jgi:tetratricopeptide (TPR) repeat protein
MQSSEWVVRIGLLMVQCALAAGCAAMSESIKGASDAVTGTTGAPPVVAVPAAPVVPAPTGVVSPAASKTELPNQVSPAVQRAFDAARTALRAGRIDEAERGFRALTQTNPELGGAYANLGLIYDQAGKPELAVAALESAVRASPKQPVYFNQLGIAYRHNGQFTQARDAYQKAIALDANYALPYLNLAILTDMYLWDGQRALELYERYLALAPSEDAVVVKWVADLKNRQREHQSLSKKEQP